MKIRMHHSLERARKVVALVSLPEVVAGTSLADAFVHAQTWDNGREQGLALRVSVPRRQPDGMYLAPVEATIFVAEARSSDETLVVYDPGPRLPDNKPSDAAWEAGRRYFRRGDERAAAAHVRALIMQLAGRGRS